MNRPYTSFIDLTSYDDVNEQTNTSIKTQIDLTSNNSYDSDATDYDDINSDSNNDSDNDSDYVDDGDDYDYDDSYYDDMTEDFTDIIENNENDKLPINTKMQEYTKNLKRKRRKLEDQVIKQGNQLDESDIKEYTIDLIKDQQQKINMLEDEYKLLKAEINAVWDLLNAASEIYKQLRDENTQNKKDNENVNPKQKIRIIKTQKLGKPKRLPWIARYNVWIEFIGHTTDGLCFCCGIEPITIANFQCGHIQARSKGGNDHISNLRPICGSCNQSMGTTNMREFIETCGFPKNPKWNDLI